MRSSSQRHVVEHEVVERAAAGRARAGSARRPPSRRSKRIVHGRQAHISSRAAQVEQVAVLGRDRLAAQLAALELGLARAPRLWRASRRSREATAVRDGGHTRAPPRSATLTMPASSTSSGTGSRCSSGCVQAAPGPARRRSAGRSPRSVSSVPSSAAPSSDAAQPGSRAGRRRGRPSRRTNSTGSPATSLTTRAAARSSRHAHPAVDHESPRARRHDLDLQQLRPGAAPGSTRPRPRPRSTSGAALWIASSIASLSVIVDDGQPLAAALQPQAHDAVLDADQLDAAAVGLQVRPHALQRAAHPLARAAPGAGRGAAAGARPARRSAAARRAVLVVPATRRRSARRPSP